MPTYIFDKNVDLTAIDTVIINDEEEEKEFMVDNEFPQEGRWIYGR